MANNTSSFHINGFWFHVKWDNNSKVGLDQNGDIWYNKQNPRSEMGGMRPKPERKEPASNKDYFLQERESYHEYFHTRSAMMK